jgi:hypothetical protein
VAPERLDKVSRLSVGKQSLKGESVNKFFTMLGVVFVTLSLTTGCAQTKISDREQLVTGPLPRPATIWVYDFAASPTDIPPESALAGQFSPYATPQSQEDIALGRQLGAEIENELVNQINAMGMQANHAVPGTRPQINDIVIRGYLISFNQGDEEKRVAVGFGAGNTDLKATVEGFQVTERGWVKLGSGNTDAQGAKKPGAALGVVALIATHNPVGLIVSSGMSAYGEKTGSDKVQGRAQQTAKEIADQLKIRFKQEGWIN